MGYISPFYVLLGNQIRNDWSILWQFRSANLYPILLCLVNQCGLWCRVYAAMVEKMKLLYKPTKLTCDFIVPNIAKSEGVQKVIGFSRGWHHWNSIRLGIRKEDNYCVLYFYAYIKGQRIIQRIGRYQIGELIKVRLHWGYYIECKANDGYAFRVAPKCSFPIGYLLYPYAEKDGVEGVQVPIDIKIMNLKIS
jgi:hypothetical protein